MNYYIIKRDGRKVDFNFSKIQNAIEKAANEIHESVDSLDVAYLVTEKIKQIGKSDIEVEKVQDIIEQTLIELNYKKVQEVYSLYRKERTAIRDKKHDLMQTVESIGVQTDRDNANVGNNFSSKLLRIASETNKWHNLSKMPKSLAKLHELGDLYYHDLDSYNLTLNCLHVDTGKHLSQGFNTGYGTIKAPKRIESAAELSCILLQSSQNDLYGGQSHVNFDNDLALFVEPTRNEIEKEYEDLKKVLSEEEFKKYVETKLNKRIAQSMQAIVFNLNTMHVRHVG